MYTVYKTVNLVNRKYYIGVHKTNDPNDSYLGSGKLLKRAIEKYGVESFKKEIIAIFENKEGAYLLERELVILGENCYNLKVGGEGGFDWINNNNLTSSKFGVKFTTEQRRKGGATLAQKLKTDPLYQERRTEINRKILSEHNVSFAGNTHSDETKEKMRVKAKERTGQRNSQFGTMWITDGITNKKISKDSPVPNGWRKGRT